MEQHEMELVFIVIVGACFLLAYRQVKKERSPIGKTLSLGLYLVGLVGLVSFFVWIYAGLMYALGEDPGPPDYTLAFIPHWVFLFIPFLLLGLNSNIKKSAKKIGEEIDQFIKRLDDRLWGLDD
ncbi:MAG: hypothetical protein PHO31_00945 [Candidatus Pacebacteria bacterium]|nr:hypothetical protein [Candidatus Paceibacterota bacterium]